MEVEKRFELTKVTITRKLPLLAPFLAKLKFEESEEIIPSLALAFREKRILYNKEFVDSLDNRDLVFSVAHELMHYVLYHDAEALKNKAHFTVFNLATDSIINYLLIKRLEIVTSLNVVTFGVIRKMSKSLASKSDEDLIRMTHIEIAKELIKDIQDFMKDLEQAINDIDIDNNENGNGGYGKDSEEREDGNGNEGGNGKDSGEEREEGTGTGIDEKELDKKLEDVIEKHFGDRLSEGEKEAVKESIKEALRRKETGRLGDKEKEELRKMIEKGVIIQKEIEKSRGVDVGGISNILDILLRKKNRNWKKILRETFSEIRTIAKDYDYTRASKKVWILKREFGVNTFIPDIQKESDIVNVVIGIDVSGSISDREYKEFVNEIYTLASDVKVKGWIVMWEAEVTKVIEMRNGWNKEVFEQLKERTGYGGTVIESFFKKAGELVRNKRNTYLIVLTDGETEKVEREWVKGWKKVVFITKSKESLRDVENERNVEIAYYD